MITEHAALSKLIREAILASDDQIGEFIKWNVPAFFYRGEMKPFDHKEYKRDILVFNTRQKDHVPLILPTGAKLTNVDNLLEGNYPDGRRMIKFHNEIELLEKNSAFQQIIKEWISLME